MKSWFPLTDYDFYAYLTCGAIVLVAGDYCFDSSRIIMRQDWPIIQILFWVALAYLLGQILAGPSSAFIEHFLFRNVLHNPTEVLLQTASRTSIERLIANTFAQREYAPLPNEISANATINAQKHFDNISVSTESVFYIAYSLARQDEDTRTRLDQFRNLYALCRNACFAFFISGLLLISKMAIYTPNKQDFVMLLLSFLFSFGMFGRFVKFYAAFASEVLRKLATTPPALLDKASA